MRVARPFHVVAAVLVVITFCAIARGATREGHTFSTEGAEIFYRVAGSGEPLLLLHGGTQAGSMWDEDLDDLSARYRVIVPDLRGHGASTNPNQVWSTHQFARDTYALLDHLGVKRFRAIGASAGAMTLLHMAISQPGRFEALVVVGAGTYIPTSCREILERVNVDDLSESEWNRLRARHIHGDEQIKGLYSWVASLAEDDTDLVVTPPQLSRITAPTLVVHGDRDYCFPASMAWEIFDAIPTAYLWVVPNGGHVPIHGPHREVFLNHVLQLFGGDWEPR